MPILTAIQTIQRDSSISFPMLGNFSIDPPSYFTVFGRNIYFYGVLIALGFLLAILYCGRRSRDFGIQADDFYDLSGWTITSQTQSPSSRCMRAASPSTAG